MTTATDTASKRTAAANPPARPKTEIPDWLTETPEETAVDYFLAMVEDGDHLQTIDLTREEFIEVKKAIAQMRGLTMSSDVKLRAKSVARMVLRNECQKFLDDFFERDEEQDNDDSVDE